jgi:hypothetical protein
VADRIYRILVTGSRVVDEEAKRYVRMKLFDVTRPLTAMGFTVVIVDGECPYGGVDQVAHEWALEVPEAISERHPADWPRLGAKAGPARNQEMVDAGAKLCLAFPGRISRGTHDCIRRAGKAGIRTMVFPLY